MTEGDGRPLEAGPIVVLQPDVTPSAPRRGALAPRTRLPERPVVGLIDNRKPLAKELLSVLAEELGKRLGRPVEAVLVSKQAPSYALGDREVAELAARCDAVIAGLGDCGACSSCSVHDAIKVETAGTPATVLITEPFQSIVASNAAKLGVPGYHALILPHPVWGKDDDELRELALRVVDAAIAQLAPGGDAANEAQPPLAEPIRRGA